MIKSICQFSLLIASVAVISPVGAFGENIENIKRTRNFTLVNPCNGEVIQMTCVEHFVSNLTEKNGKTHVTLNRSFRCKGTGSFGNNYVLSQNGNINVQSDSPNFTETIVRTRRWITTGKAPNFLLKTTNKMVVKNGEVKVSKTVMETKCTGK